MPEIVLLDTGPLVALLDEDEEHYAWSTGQMRGFKPPLVICEAVLTETCFLLQHHSRGRLQIRLWVQSGFLSHRPLNETSVTRALVLMERYANVPMSFADACLVAMADEQPEARIFTLDRDFQIYRQAGDRPLALVAPFAAS
jgi:predicted nucleic acid-binding protein